MVKEESGNKYREYTREYNKRNYSTILLRFRNDTEADVYKHVKSQSCINQYILNLIKKDIKG